MIRCPQCKQKYPGEIMMGGVCPICALKNRNETHGMPANTPFQGEIASDLHAQAVAFDKKRGAVK